MSEHLTGEKIPKSMRKKVNEIIIDNPREYFIWLNKPYAFEANEDENGASHCRGFDSMADIRAALKYVEICPCKYCNK